MNAFHSYCTQSYPVLGQSQIQYLPPEWYLAIPSGIWIAFISTTPRVHNKRLGDSYVSSTKCMVQTGVATIIILWVHTHTPTPPLPHIPKNVMRHLF